MRYEVLPFDRESVSVPVGGTLAGLSASLNVALNVSSVGLIAPLRLVVTRFDAETVGRLVSYVNDRTLVAERFPAVSTDHTDTV